MEGSEHASTSSRAEEEVEILYRTRSLCPLCALVERKGMQWKSAIVLARGGSVWLSVGCSQHGSQETLYCSSRSFFERMRSLDPSTGLPELVEIEDLERALAFKHPSYRHRPLVASFSLFEGNSFVNDQQIQSQLKMLCSVYDSEAQFVLRIEAKLAMDMDILNDRAKRVALMVKNTPAEQTPQKERSWISSVSAALGGEKVTHMPCSAILLEASYERLMLLAQRDDTVFLERMMYPALKMFIARGEEEEAVEQLQKLIDTMSRFSKMRMVVTLIVEPPLADLTAVMALLRRHPQLVRVIVFSCQRTLRTAVGALKQREEVEERLDGAEPSQQDRELLERISTQLSADPMQLLEHISACTNGDLTPDDFFPGKMTSVLEPLLKEMGYGRFSLDAAPFCAFVGLLVSTASHRSVALNRVFNVEKFCAEMAPVIKGLAGKSIGWMQARSVKKVFQSCSVDGSALPDIVSMMTQRQHARTTAEFIDNMQFVAVHNNMDLGSMDSTRRCRCASITTSFLSRSLLSASCTGCL